MTTPAGGDWRDELAGLAAAKTRTPPEEFNRLFHDHLIGYQSDEFQREHYYQLGDPGTRARVERLLAELLPVDGPVADLGTGVGTLVNQVAQRGGCALGLDYSVPSVRTAQRLHRRGAPPGTWLFCGADTGRLPLAGGSCAAVVMADLVEHLTREQKQRTFREAWRVLRPGGKLVVGTPNRWTERRTELLDRYWHRKPPDLTTLGHIGLSSPGALARELRAAGFVRPVLHARIEFIPLLGRSSALCRRAERTPLLRELLTSYLVLTAEK